MSQCYSEKKEELKERDKPPSEWRVCRRRYNFAGYEKGYPFLALRLIITTQNTRSRMYAMA